MPIICNIGSAEYRYRLIFQTLILFALYLFCFAVPPSVRPDPPDGNYVVKKGRKVELRCVASGNPDPTITWTRVVSESDE